MQIQSLPFFQLNYPGPLATVILHEPRASCNRRVCLQCARGGHVSSHTPRLICRLQRRRWLGISHLHNVGCTLPFDELRVTRWLAQG